MFLIFKFLSSNFALALLVDVLFILVIKPLQNFSGLIAQRAYLGLKQHVYSQILICLCLYLSSTLCTYLNGLGILCAVLIDPLRKTTFCCIPLCSHHASCSTHDTSWCPYRKKRVHLGRLSTNFTKFLIEKTSFPFILTFYISRNL